MTIALATISLALVGLLVQRERVNARRAEAEASRLRAEIEVERNYSARVLDEAGKERRELYQRIQAPEVAVAEAVREARGSYEKRKPRGHDHDIHASEVDGG